MPEANASGRDSRLSTAGAELGPAQKPTARPKAAKGMAPDTRTPASESQEVNGSRTPPARMPAVNSSATTSAENSRHMVRRPKIQASGGMGVARLNSIHPWPRSTATATPNPNSAAFITPRAPKVAIR